MKTLAAGNPPDSFKLRKHPRKARQVRKDNFAYYRKSSRPKKKPGFSNTGFSLCCPARQGGDLNVMTRYRRITG
jgi:hypothetical protein